MSIRKNMKIHSIAFQMGIRFLIVAIIPLLIVSALTLYHSEEYMKDEVMSRLSAVANGKQLHIEDYFHEMMHGVNIMANNPVTANALEDLNAAYSTSGPDSQTYVAVEKQYRSLLSFYKEEFEAHDLFLISPTGEILFTLLRESDFATNLVSGPYRDTSLAEAFERAIGERKTRLSGFRYYQPSHTTAEFIAAPVKKGEEIVGVVGVQMSIEAIHELARDYQDLGETGEIVLASRQDGVAEFVAPLRHDPQAAFHKKIVIGDSNALPVQYAVQGQNGAGYSVDYRGQETISIWRYLPLSNLGMVVKIDQDEAFAHVDLLEFWTGITVLVTLVFVIILSLWFSRSISKPLINLTARARKIADGDLTGEIHTQEVGEIGDLAESFGLMLKSQQQVAHQAEIIAAGKVSEASMIAKGEKDTLGSSVNRMIEMLRGVVKQTTMITQGDFRVHFAPQSDMDELGLALQSMTIALRDATTENKQHIWLKNGQAELNDLLQGDQGIPFMASNILSCLVQIVGAGIGFLYLIDEEKENLELAGSYARSDDHGPVKNKIKIGQGLIGQAALEKTQVLVKDIPKDYVRIGSATGDALPRHILILPFLYKESLVGVIEIGSFQEFSAADQELFRMVKDNIAIAFISARSRSRTKMLLQKTQQQAEELIQQQEELQQTNEELEEQTSNLRKSESQLQDQQEELRVANEELEERAESLLRRKEEVQQKNSELESARQDIEKKAQELARASKYKSEFLANMSHELRTPLNSLLLLSRSLSDNKNGNLLDQQVKSANIIYNSGKELLELINEILDLSKIEAGRVEIECKGVIIEDLADGLRNSFQHVAAEKGLDFNIVISQDAPVYINTDQQRLEQIIKNLLSNAIKFSHHGSVTMEFRLPTDKDNLSDNFLSRRNSLAIAIIDTGIGIALEKQEIIFEAFQQAEGGTARQYGGTGLGLSISRELAQLLGGNIQLTHSSEEGSIFVLYIPLNYEDFAKSSVTGVESKQKPTLSTVRSGADLKEQQQDVFVQPPSIAPTTVEDDSDTITNGDKSILIIEDDHNFVTILKDQCHAKGFKCLIAQDGEQGLAIAASRRPAGIILDLKLPGMNGWHVMESLKKNPDTRHIPIHIMSAEEARIDAFRMGAIGFLTKPVTQEQIDDAFSSLSSTIVRKVRELLVVEDDPLLREQVAELIGNGDVKITEAGSGQEALDALQGNEYDCMVLDLGLPDMTGLELLSRLEKEPKLKTPPVIVYTGRELGKEEEAILHKYADSIIIKGVKSEERLLDETALFLHRVVDNLPASKKRMIVGLYEQDATLKGKKILLVDDDMRNIYALSTLLNEKGIDTIMAGDGEKALELLDENPDVDLVLMDIMMPGMDGYETTRRIRAQSKLHDLPIIAVTAKAMKDDRAKCLDAGANDYIAKPVDMTRLLSMMRVWLYR